MRYTTNGYKVPETDDQDFWGQFAFDIERLDAHNHDGVNSEKVVPGAIDPYKKTVLVADWVGVLAPYYYDVEFPVSWNMSWTSGEPCPVQVVVRDANHEQVYLKTERMTGGDGVRVYTHVKAIYTVGLY